MDQHSANANPAPLGTDLIHLKTLPLSSKARICWGFAWRSIVLAIGTGLSGGLIGGIVGGILGVVFYLIGIPQEDGLHFIQIISGILGLLWGCFCLYFYIRWLLAAKFGQYRLQLVRA